MSSVGLGGESPQIRGSTEIESSPQAQTPSLSAIDSRITRLAGIIKNLSAQLSELENLKYEIHLESLGVTQGVGANLQEVEAKIAVIEHKLEIAQKAGKFLESALLKALDKAPEESKSSKPLESLDAQVSQNRVRAETAPPSLREPASPSLSSQNPAKASPKLSEYFDTKTGRVNAAMNGKNLEVLHKRADSAISDNESFLKESIANKAEPTVIKFAEARLASAIAHKAKLPELKPESSSDKLLHGMPDSEGPPQSEGNERLLKTGDFASSSSSASPASAPPAPTADAVEISLASTVSGTDRPGMKEVEGEGGASKPIKQSRFKQLFSAIKNKLSRSNRNVEGQKSPTPTPIAMFNAQINGKIDQLKLLNVETDREEDQIMELLEELNGFLANGDKFSTASDTTESKKTETSLRNLKGQLAALREQSGSGINNAYIDKANAEINKLLELRRYI